MYNDAVTITDSNTDSDYSSNSLFDDSVFDNTSVASSDSLEVVSVADPYLKGTFDNTYRCSVFLFLILVFLFAQFAFKFIYNLIN